MKPLKVIGVILTATLGMTGCLPVRTGTPAPQQAGGAAAPDAPTVAGALAQVGYVGVPMRPQGSYRFVQARIATTPVTLLLDSDAPFDLLLDPSIQLGSQAGVHLTDVLSAYWTSFTSKGNWHWGVVDRLTIGTSTLEALEAKLEPSPSPVTRAVLGATALMDRGAIIDYATDTVYLLASDSPRAPIGQTTAKQPTLRAALDRAGQYRTFLALIQQAGLMPLLEHTNSRDAQPDSVAWLGLRLRAEQLSGVGAMPPNDVHLQLTRAEIDQELRRPGRYTVFVPTDAAFARVPAETLRAVRSDTARLARLLRAHFSPGVAIDVAGIRSLIRGVAQPGFHYPAFGFHVLGPRIDVDQLTSWEEGRIAARAAIVDADLRAVNGIAHGIDHVLGLSASPLAAALARRGYVGVPLYRREDGNGYLVQATVNGVPVRLTVATGTPLAVALDRQWAARLRPSQNGEYHVAFDSVSLGPGDVTTDDFSGSITLAQQQGYRTATGVVGAVLLVKYHAVIDCAAGMLYLQRPTGGPTPH